MCSPLAFREPVVGLFPNNPRCSPPSKPGSPEPPGARAAPALTCRRHRRPAWAGRCPCALPGGSGSSCTRACTRPCSASSGPGSRCPGGAQEKYAIREKAAWMEAERSNPSPGLSRSVSPAITLQPPLSPRRLQHPPLLPQARPRRQLEVEVELVVVRKLLDILLRSKGPRGGGERTRDKG